MALRILGVMLLLAGLIFAAAAFYAAGPQPALDAEDMASNQRVFLFLGGGAAVLLIGALMVLLRKR
jgi:hypothetical protein